jgi:hypothetical protein
MGSRLYSPAVSKTALNLGKGQPPSTELVVQIRYSQRSFVLFFSTVHESLKSLVLFA